MGEEKFMTLEQFAENYGVKISTVKSNIERIPGLEYVNREYRIIEGTRYFYTVRSAVKDNSVRLCLILKALNKNQYVDAEILKCSESDFNNLLSQLEEQNLIKKNNSKNKYGTNGFNITILGTEYIQQKKWKVIKSIAESVGTGIGAFVAQQMSN